MNLPFKLSSHLIWLLGSVQFIRKHFLIIAGLGFIAGLGRVVQLGGFVQITSFHHLLLEVIIESARIFLFLYVLGFANIKRGALRIKHLFTQKANRKIKFNLALQNLKKECLALICNITGFLLIAAGFNFLIDLVAYETCQFLTLKSHQIIASSTSEWTILLFFKNLSEIPFTLVFEAIFLLWITNKLNQDYSSFSQIK